jgi:hypothetical protein
VFGPFTASGEFNSSALVILIFPAAAASVIIVP